MPNWACVLTSKFKLALIILQNKSFTILTTVYIIKSTEIFVKILNLPVLPMDIISVIYDFVSFTSVAWQLIHFVLLVFSLGTKLLDIHKTLVFLLLHIYKHPTM